MKLTLLSSMLIHRISSLVRWRSIVAQCLRTLRKNNLGAGFTSRHTRRAYRDLDAAFERLCWCFNEAANR